MLCAFPVVHVACQNAVFDEDGVFRGRSLVVQIDRERCGPAECGVGKVHQAYQLGSHAFVQGGTGYGAAQHQVCLHRMAYGFMGQHTGHETA